MEKGQESKQKRKTPLTTIAISQEYAKKLDEYLNGTGITRKEFVELSVDYFQRTGFDLRGEAFDLSPLEKVAGRLEQSAKIMERHNEGTEAVHLLLQAVREQTAKQLPAPELIVRWNTKEKKWESKWTRSDVSSVSMIPAVSIKSEMVFVCGWNDASGWEVTGLDWKSGATRHRSILGKNNRANGAYAIIQYLANGDLLFNSVAGPIRVKY